MKLRGLFPSIPYSRQRARLSSGAGDGAPAPWTRTELMRARAHLCRWAARAPCPRCGIVFKKVRREKPNAEAGAIWVAYCEVCDRRLAVSADMPFSIQPPVFETLPASAPSGVSRPWHVWLALGLGVLYAAVLSSVLSAPARIGARPVVKSETTLVHLPPFVFVEPPRSYATQVAVASSEVADEPVAYQTALVATARERLAKRTARIVSGRDGLAVATQLRMPAVRPARVDPIGTPSRELALWGPGDVYEPPRLLTRGESRYPAELQAARLAGVVVVDFVVDTLGRAEPESIMVMESTHPAFDDAARDVVITSVYRPGYVNGNPMRVPARLRLTFTPGVMHLPS